MGLPCPCDVYGKEKFLKKKFCWEQKGGGKMFSKTLATVPVTKSERQCDHITLIWDGAQRSNLFALVGESP